MAYLLPEKVTDILSCFPVKSLLRFRCLSKPCCSLIDSHEFQLLHLDNYNKKQEDVALVVSDSCFHYIFLQPLLDFSNPREDIRVKRQSIDFIAAKELMNPLVSQNRRFKYGNGFLQWLDCSVKFLWYDFFVQSSNSTTPYTPIRVLF